VLWDANLDGGWEQPRRGIAVAETNESCLSFCLGRDFLEPAPQRVEVALYLDALIGCKERQAELQIGCSIAELGSNRARQLLEHCDNRSRVLVRSTFQHRCQTLGPFLLTTNQGGEKRFGESRPASRELLAKRDWRNSECRRIENRSDLTDSRDAGKAPVANEPTCCNDLLVEAVTVSSRDYQSAVGNDRHLVDDPVGDYACRGTSEIRLGADRPDLGAQKPNGLGDEAMSEVGENDVVVAGGNLMVECDWPQFARDGMGETLGGPGPASGKAREAKRALRPAVVCWTLHNRFDEFRLMSKCQRRPHDPLDIHRCEVKFDDALGEALSQPPDLFAQVPVEPDEAPFGCGPVDLILVEMAAATEHLLFDLGGDDRSG